MLRDPQRVHGAVPGFHPLANRRPKRANTRGRLASHPHFARELAKPLVGQVRGQVNVSGPGRFDRQPAMQQVLRAVGSHMPQDYAFLHALAAPVDVDLASAILDRLLTEGASAHRIHTPRLIAAGEVVYGIRMVPPESIAVA